MKNKLDERFKIESEPRYSLHECLELLNKEHLENICNCIKETGFKDDNKDINIKNLEIIIPKFFKHYLSDYILIDELAILDKALKKNSLNEYKISFIFFGFMFEFKDSTCIIPNELLDIYKDFLKNNLKHELDLRKLKRVFSTYLLATGLLPIEFFQDIIINKYKYDVSLEDIEKISKELEIHIYKDKYYTSLEIGKIDDILKKLLMTIKINKTKYIELMEKDIINYSEHISSLFDELTKITKSREITTKIVYTLSLFSKEAFTKFREIFNSLKYSRSKQNQIMDVIEKYFDDIRFWGLGGQSKSDVLKDSFLKKNKLSKKPKDNSLKNCLELVDKYTYKYYLECFYAKNIKELVNNMKEEIAIELEKYDIETLCDLINADGMLVSNINSLKGALYFFLFNYQEYNEVKVILPKEVFDIIGERLANGVNINHYENPEDLVEQYLHMNGVIEKTKLQELLKEYHDIDISIEEIDKIVDSYDNCYQKGKYYHIWYKADLDILENFNKTKTAFGKYQKCDVDKVNRMVEFESKMMEYDDSDLMNDIIFQAELFGLNPLYFEDLRDDGASISKKYERDVLAIYKEYIDSICCWSFNGYTVLEVHDMNQRKSKKVGRNEPCPCGSGKKYKHCCGK